MSPWPWLFRSFGGSLEQQLRKESDCQLALVRHRLRLTTHMQTIPVVKIVRRPKKDINIQETAVPMMNIELRTMLSEKESWVLTPAC